LTVTAETKT